jgi:hypothetical protein
MDVTREQFLAMASEAGFSDTMRFQLFVAPDDRDPSRSFSAHGVDDFMGEIRAYVLARLLGHWDETGAPPQELLATVSLEWRGKTQNALANDPLPWYYGRDRGELETADGLHRVALQTPEEES